MKITSSAAKAEPVKAAPVKAAPVKAAAAKAPAAKSTVSKVSKTTLAKAAPIKAKVTTRATKKVPPARGNLDPSVEEVRKMIATAAYYRAQKRGFEVGYEQEDWLMAEKEISQLLSP